MFSTRTSRLLTLFFCPPQFVFEYESGWETSAVIALDDVSISRGRCFPPSTNQSGNTDNNYNGNLKLHSEVSHTLKEILCITNLILFQFEFCEN